MEKFYENKSNGDKNGWGYFFSINKYFTVYYVGYSLLSNLFFVGLVISIGQRFINFYLLL